MARRLNKPDANSEVNGFAYKQWFEKVWLFLTDYLSGVIILPKTSGTGIKVDVESPTFGWNDLIGTVEPKAVGAGSPARAVYIGGQLGGYAFVVNDVCDFEFHIPHDYVAGTDMYVHVHWSHTDAVSITGNAVFDFYYSYAKGHNQANFSAEKDITITYATTDLTTTPQYRHRLDEAALTAATATATLMDRDDLEPDGLILATLKLTTLPTMGGAGKLFIHHVDIHYQSTGVGTKQKAPNFYV